MRFHPFFTPLWLAFFLVPIAGFGLEDEGPTQSVPTLCQNQEESVTVRRVREMTDKDVETECGLEKGAGLSLCRSVVLQMRDSAKAAASARAASCHRVGIMTGQRSLENQNKAFITAGEGAREAQRGKLAEADIQNKGLKDMREYRDQMDRRHKSLLSDRHRLADLPPEVKQRVSVVSGNSQPPDSRVASAPEPSYDDYKLRPAPVPSYNSPQVIDASTSGSRNLAEYEQKLPYMIERQERMLKMMGDFEEETRTSQVRNETAALEFGRQATSLFSQAEKMGEVDGPSSPTLKRSPESKGAVPAGVVAQKKEGLTLPGAKGAESAAGPGAKASALASLPGSPGQAGETSEEAAVLDSFQSRLHEDGKGKLSGPERGRLRDLLRRQMAGRGRSHGEGSHPGELVEEMLEEELAQESRAPASTEIAKANNRRGVVRLDVQGAMEEIEAQLEEIDRSMGILSADSESLFDRVKTVHRRSEKSGSVGRQKS